MRDDIEIGGQAQENRGTRVQERVPAVAFPNADEIVRRRIEQRPAGAVDILLVNPPAPDGAIWIRSQHRVGRRSREGMVWPQVDLAQMAALFPDHTVDVVDAVAARMGWAALERLLQEKRPAFYVTQVTAPTLQNDMYGCFVAKSLGAITIAFGTHVTPMPEETLRAYPALDYVLRGEPELTLRELVDTLACCGSQVAGGDELQVGRLAGCRFSGEAEGTADPWSGLDPAFRKRLEKLFTDSDPEWQPAWVEAADPLERWNVGTSERLNVGTFQRIPGLAWRRGGEIVINPDRPLIRHLDDLPLPRHDLLPLSRYKAPLVGGPYAFVVSSRGCPAGCRFCIKHVSYGSSVRFRSPENVLAELALLLGLGVRDIHMYADLFTVNRDHVVGICQGILERGWKVRWTCNSRVDFVDEELLRLMARSGCGWISWGIESGNAEILKRAHKGYEAAQPLQALTWARRAGIKNWGYFIIGLPGETEETIQETIRLALRLPLDLALFHIAAPHPGTPFFYEVVGNGWFRPGTRWEEVDMDRSTVLQYPGLPAERLEHWARVAFRRWALRPGPLWTGVKMLFGDLRLLPTAARVALESAGWGMGRGER